MDQWVDHGRGPRGHHGPMGGPPPGRHIWIGPRRYHDSGGCLGGCLVFFIVGGIFIFIFLMVIFNMF